MRKTCELIFVKKIRCTFSSTWGLNIIEHRIGWHDHTLVCPPIVSHFTLIRILRWGKIKQEINGLVAGV